MGDEPTLDDIKAQARQERRSRESLEQLIARTGGDASTLLALARACVRDDKLVPALAYYDQAEMLGSDEAHTERRVVGRYVGDFPDMDVDEALA